MEQSIKISNPSTDKGIYAFWVLVVIYLVFNSVQLGFLLALLLTLLLNIPLIPIYIWEFRLSFSVTFVDDCTVSNGFYNFKTNIIDWKNVKYLYFSTGYWKKGNYVAPFPSILASTIKSKHHVHNASSIKRSKQALIRLCEESVDDVLAIINERFGLSLTRDLMDFDKKAPARIIWCYTDASNNAQKALAK